MYKLTACPTHCELVDHLFSTRYTPMGRKQKWETEALSVLLDSISDVLFTETIKKLRLY